jgi:hypothetical protein
MSVAQMKNQKLFNKNLSKQDSKNFTKTKALKKKADKTFYLGFDFMEKNNPAFYHEENYKIKTHRSTPMINNISFVVSYFQFNYFYISLQK